MIDLTNSYKPNCARLLASMLSSIEFEPEPIRGLLASVAVSLYFSMGDSEAVEWLDKIAHGYSIDAGYLPGDDTDTLTFWLSE